MNRKVLAISVISLVVALRIFFINEKFVGGFGYTKKFSMVLIIISLILIYLSCKLNS